MITITDLFCGAGGSSSGAIQVPGVTVRMAANHWTLAVETHNTNHPGADHDTADISQVDPRRYPRTDILWASPECTNHSQAKGKKRGDQQPDLFGELLPDAAAERSRATMWDVLRFAEVHRYRAIVVENVVDVRDWPLWPAWITGLDNLGYSFEVVYLNSMFAQAAGAPAPQSRDRLYVVAWRRGNRAPDLPRWTRPPAYCSSCDTVVRPIQAWKRIDRQRGRYSQQYVWRCPTTSCRGARVSAGVLPAAAAIDWSLAGERIGDRARPLAPKTVARIEAGLRRYAQPIHLEAAGNTFERRPGVRAWPIDEPLKTVHTTASKAVACPPFLAPLRSGRPRTIAITEPLATVVADGANHAFVDPMLVPAGGTWNDDAQTVAEPFRTRTTRDTDALVVPLRNNGVARPAGEAPAPTVAAAGNHHALVMRNMTARGDQGQMSYPPTEPMRTVLAEQRQSLVRWDHVLYGYDSGELRPVARPLPTQTTLPGDALLGPDIAVEDCTFRMLEPHEIQAAMAFDAGYIVLGNKRERVRQLGNAVTPPAARDLIAAVVESLTGELTAA